MPRWSPVPTRWSLPAAVAGGALAWAAFPPVSIRPLAVVGPALVIRAVSGQSPRRAALLGLGFGVAFFLPLLQWLQPGAGTNAWLVVVALEAAFYALLGVFLALASRLPSAPLAWAAAWTLAEAVRGRLPLGGFTWGRLAFSQDDGPLLRWAAIGGGPLVTFVVVLLAGLLVVAARDLWPQRDLFTRGRPRRAAVPAALAALVGASALLLPAPGAAAAGAPRATVAVVQGNVPRLGLSAFEQRLRVLRNHVDATLALAADVDAGRRPRPALVVWPENSTDIDPRTDDVVAALIEQAATAVGAPILVGAVLDRADDRVENAGLVWQPGAGPRLGYVKQHLVPFGEYVPLRRLLAPVFGRLAMVPRDFAPGTGRAAFDVGGIRVGDVICYEVAYDGLVRDAVRHGAQVLIVQTNNATFGRSHLSHQQLAMSRVRAVEHGRAVLVAATSGISAVVRPDGRLDERSRIWTREVFVNDVPLVTRRTLATRAGDWPEIILAALGAIAVAAGAASGRWSA